MSHRILEVTAAENFMIKVKFLGGNIKLYDVKQLYDQFPQFQILQQNPDMFQEILVDAGGYGLYWNDDLDLDAETVWDNGTLIETYKEKDINRLIAYQIISAREEMQITQKQLSAKTGIYQADISKIERGKGNPSLDTLMRLAEGLNMQLDIKLINKTQE